MVTASSYRNRRRFSSSEREAMQRESLARAQGGTSLTNDLAVISQFHARGIEAQPRVDTFTYQAWRALGRQVRRGEKGVKVVTWIPVEKQNEQGVKVPDGLRPWSATVFHVSQTDSIAPAG